MRRTIAMAVALATSLAASLPAAGQSPTPAQRSTGRALGASPCGRSRQLPDGYIVLRSNLKSHDAADVAKSVAYGKKIKVYPLSQAAAPQATVFTDAADVLFDSTIRYDASFFDLLDRIVQTEPWLERDRAMIDSLRTLGIEKGKPFSPDAKRKAALAAGAKEAQAWLEARYDAGLPPFYEGSRWTMPAFPELIEAAQVSFANPDKYPVDIRGLTYRMPTSASSASALASST